MSVDAKLMTALTPLGYDVDNGVSFSKNRNYFAFRYSVIPTDFGDDEPGHDLYLVQVHFFCSLSMNVQQLKRATRRALFAAGFTKPSVVDASDDNSRHLVFECEISE